MPELVREFHRVPRVRNLGYLLTYLRCVDEGRYDAESLLNSIIEERTKLEQEKLRALGKGRTFDKQELLRKGKGKDLAHSARQLASQLELVGETTEKLVLLEQGKLILELGLENENARHQLIVRLVERYPAFRQILLAIRDADGSITLPTARGKEIFQKEARRYGITCDQWDYEIVRDLATQLEVVNWRIDLQGADRNHKVYLICEVVTWSDLKHAGRSAKPESFKYRSIEHFKGNLKSHSSLKGDASDCAVSQGYVVASRLGNPIFLKSLATDQNEFDDVIWKEYLGLTEQSAMRPIFFSDLREKVCERLLMSNVGFDIQVIRMINSPSKYRTKVYAGGGALPHLPGIDMLRKDLPPKTGTDEYMTYLKLDRPE